MSNTMRFWLSLLSLLLLLPMLLSCGKVEDPLTSLEVEEDSTFAEEVLTPVYSVSYRNAANYFSGGYYYWPNNVREIKMAGGKYKTFAKYNLQTGEAFPVCGDPVCKHGKGKDVYNTPLVDTDCPFVCGENVFAMEDGWIYYSTTVELISENNECLVFRYNTKTLRQQLLFRMQHYVLGNQVLGKFGDRIYYTDYVIREEDAMGDCYIYRYDLSKGKSEPVCIYDRFFCETVTVDDVPLVYPPNSTETVRTENDRLQPEFMDGDGRVFFLGFRRGDEYQNPQRLYMMEPEKGGELIELNPEGALTYQCIFSRNGKLYFLSDSTLENTGDLHPNRLLSYDLTASSVGAIEVLAEQVVPDRMSVCGDHLYYWEWAPRTVSVGDEAVTQYGDRLVDRDLETGEERKVLFSFSENGGVCPFYGTPFYYHGMLYGEATVVLPDPTRKLRYESAFLCFDLETGSVREVIHWS